MGGLPSQIGDRYCYYVGAFLKKYGYSNQFDQKMDFSKYSFSCDSITIPSNSSTFNQKLSLDLLASISETEYFGECKYSNYPIHLTKNSELFIEGLLEFIGLEKYRELTSWKNIRYLFITNHYVDKLVKDISELKNSSSNEILPYLDFIVKRASIKWKNNKIVIKEEWLRSAINNISFFYISQGELDAVLNDDNFKEALNPIINQSLSRNVIPPFQDLIKKSDIILKYDSNDNSFYEKLLLNYNFSISKKIIGELVHKNKVLVDTITELDESSLNFLSTIILIQKINMTPSLLKRLLCECINILVTEFNNYKYNNLIIYNYDLKKIYFINSKWLLAISNQHLSVNNHYLLKTIKNVYSLPLSQIDLKTAIIEAERQKENIFDDESFDLDK